MGVTTTQTNKPFNPRGNDQSPKGFNRAKLYSGKALDFDGVNDYVETSAVPLPSAGAISFYYQADATGGEIAECGGSTDDFRITINSLCGFYTGAEYRVSTSGLWPIDDKFHFVVFAWGDFGTKFYLNGEFLKENTNRPADFSSVPTTLYIGARGGSSNEFDGQLAGFKIFNTALTAAQVADLYNNPEKVVPTGVDNTALKLWLPMQEGAGTTAINGAPDALGSEQIENGDFATDSDWTKGSGWTISGGTANCNSGSSTELYQSSAVSGKTYKITFTITSYTSGNIAARAGGVTGVVRTSTGTFTDTIVANGTQLGVFNSGGFVGSIDNVSAKEISGLGTISGATWTHGIGAPVAQTAVINWNKVNVGANAVLIPQGLTSGRDLLGNLFENVRKQGALNLDGNSWAEVHDNGSLDFGTGSFSLEAWVRAKFVNTGSALNVVLNLGGNASSAGAVSMLVGSTNKVTAVYNNSYLDSNTILTEGEWYHLVVNFNGTHSQIYVNGAFDKNIARTAADISNALVKEIGKDSNVSRTYKDQIAQPRIYNRALTAEEVQRNYNAGKNTYTN